MKLELFLGILKTGLSLWDNKESTKYIDRVLKLEKEYHEELKKPDEYQSDLTLDNIMFELESISKNFVKYNTKE